MAAEPVNLLLHAPSEASLVAALDRACRDEHALRDADHWHVLLDEIADNAEGRSQLEHSAPDDSGSRYLSVAWWTDQRGIKHVRVCGGDTDYPGWHPHYSRLDHDLRPPLWHLFMDRVYRVTRAGEPARWLVSCTCGETGEPKALGWTGERCAACHDRREEGQPHEEDGRAVVFVGPGEGQAVAFSANSEQLAVSSGGWFTRIIELKTGEIEILAEHESEADAQEDYHAPLALSFDGRWAAGGVSGAWAVNFWDRTGGEGESDYRPESPGEYVRSLAFSPDGRLFAACSDEGALDLSTVEGNRIQSYNSVPDRCSGFAFSHDSNTLAVAQGNGRIELYDTTSWAIREIIQLDLQGDEPPQFIDFRAEGRQLVLITGSPVASFSLLPQSKRWHLRVWDLVAGRLTHITDLPTNIRVAALSPDGRYLAYVVHDEQHSPGEIVFWDVESWSSGGRLEWNPEDSLMDLAFAPDGQTLATISVAGVVKVWPWRLLLG